MRSFQLFPGYPRQANKHLINYLQINTTHRNLVGWTDLRMCQRSVSIGTEEVEGNDDFIGQLQEASPVALFCPRDYRVRRSIVILGQRGLRKCVVLKHIWAKAPETFFNTTYFADEIIFVTGAIWPLALSGLEDAYKSIKKSVGMHTETSDGNSLQHRVAAKSDSTAAAYRRLPQTPRRNNPRLSSDLLSCARRTVKSGRIPIAVIGPSVLSEWRASAELAAFVVLLQPAGVKDFALAAPQDVDICLTHTPGDPAKTASTIVEAFESINTGCGRSAIPWIPASWISTNPRPISSV
ncbi:unnamed protein product [Mesocestoides corti]|uniref:Uncharacterized protein n=1 Tax=Mesocestoides corti TaxID=53468 RepID=A0A0R3UAF5_MESCO|nr:unnamed protein product [Mesocestoides corti]